MNTTKDPIKHLDNQLDKSQFDFGKNLSLGFDIWKKGFGLLTAFMLIFAVISIIASMIPYIGSFANSLVISPVLTVGAFLYAYKTDFKLNPEFGDFFDGFKFAGNIVIAQLIMTVAYIVCALPIIMNVMGYFDFNELIDLQDDPIAMSEMMTDVFSSISKPLLFASILAYLVVGSICSFTFLFIAFFGLDAIPALKYSVKFTTKHFLLLFVYYIVITILAFLGMIGFIIGVILTVTLIYTCTYAAFRNVTDLEGFSNSDESDNVIDTLVDFR